MKIKLFIFVSLIGVIFLYIHHINNDSSISGNTNSIVIDGYKLTIPSNYRINRINADSIMINVAYPDMVGFSPEIRNQFYMDDGTWSNNLVRIYLSVKPSDNTRRYTNRNDQGAYIFYNLIVPPSDYTETSLSEDIDESAYVTRYIRKNISDDAGRYVMHHEDDSISIIDCIYVKTCEGKTTWKNNIAITYQFSKEHFKRMVNLDRSVVKLIDGFIQH